jgi:hypothetical protein
MDDMDEVRTAAVPAADFSGFNNLFRTMKRAKVSSSERVIEPEPEVMRPDGSINKTLQREEYQEAIKQAEKLEVETENNKPSPSPMIARKQTEQQTKVEQPQEKNQQTETAQYRINVKTLPQVKEMAKKLLPTVGQIKPEDYALACDLAIEYALTFEGVWAQRIGDRDRNEQEG